MKVYYLIYLMLYYFYLGDEGGFDVILAAAIALGAILFILLFCFFCVICLMRRR